MDIYPINLLLTEKKCLIVGGGKVATRKMGSLLAAKAAIRIVAAKPSAKIIAAHDTGDIKLKTAEFQPNDLDGIMLVYAATNDQALNRTITEQAEARGILVCSVDNNWRHGTFITPASVRRKEITIAISSHGVACRKTKLIKANLAKHIEAIERTELIILGTDHNLLNLDQREAIHLSGEQFELAGERLMTLWGIQEFMLFNTCNRIELLAAGCPDRPMIDMLKMILKLDALEPDQFYLKTGFEAFRHSCLVTAGLYSQTPGENHITAQFKELFNYAENHQWSGTVIKSLRDNIMHVTKHLRTEIIPLLKVFEIEELVIDYLKHNISQLRNRKVLLVGSGIVGTAMKDSLLKQGCVIDWLYYSKRPPKLAIEPPHSGNSRTNVRLEPHACNAGSVTIHKLNMLETKIPEADIVITALTTNQPIISQETAGLFKDGTEIIDLGSPRNVAPALTNDNDQIKLTNMEDLKHWHRRENCDLENIISQANNIIDDHKDIYDKFKKSFIDGRQG
jgi:glutamyl-tRNA reductase